MRTLTSLILLLSVCCYGAVRGGLNAFKTTKRTPNRQTEVFAQITNDISISIAVWVKYIWTDAVVNSQQGGGEFQGLVGKGAFANNSGFGLLQFGLSSASEKLVFSFANPNLDFQNWTTTSTFVQTNSWMHIACSYTFSNSASIKFYVDGVSVPGSWTSGDGNRITVTNFDSFHTGVYGKTISSFFVGYMADLAIWTNTLSGGEIFKLAKSKVKYLPLQVKPEHLFLFYPMDTTPRLPTVSGAYNLDVDRNWRTVFNLDVGGLMWGEVNSSYHPNE